MSIIQHNRILLSLIFSLLIGFLVPQLVFAAVTNVYPNSISASDTTTEALSEVTGDDAANNPDTNIAGVGDGSYSVRTTSVSANVMYFDGFDTSAIPAGSTINGVVLKLEYGARDGYTGSNSVRYWGSGGSLSNTGITPTDVMGWNTASWDIYTNDSTAVDTLSEITNMDIEFTNNDPDGGGLANRDSIHFDYIYLEVDYTPAAVELDTITVSGTVYADAGTTALTSQPTLKLVTGTSTPSTVSTTTDPSGTFTFYNVPVSEVGMPISIFIDASSTLSGYTIISTASTTENLTGVDVYKDMVTFHDNGTSTPSLSDVALYDADDDTDIDIQASSTVDWLEILNGQTLYVLPDTTFVAAASTTYSGSLNIQGAYTAGNWAHFTGSGKTISGTTTGSSTLGNIMVSGSYTLSNNASTSDIWIRSGGSLTAPSELSIAGSFTNNGTFTNNGGTIYATGDMQVPLMTEVSYVAASSSNAGGADPYGLAFSADGTRYFVTDATSDVVASFVMSTPYDVTTSELEQTYDISGQNSYPYDVTFSSDGLAMYIVGGFLSKFIYKYTLEDPYNIATTTYVAGASVNTDSAGAHSLYVSESGKYLFIGDNADDDIDVYQISEPFSPSSLTYVESFSLTGVDVNPQGLAFTDNGLNMVVMSSSTNAIARQYRLSEPWDVSSAVLQEFYNISANSPGPSGIALSDSGDTLFVGSIDNQQVAKYTLGQSQAEFTGSLSGSSDLNHLIVSGPIGFIDNASTSDLTIQSGGKIYATTSLSIAGDYANNGTYDHASGTVYFTGTSKTSSGSLVGGNSLYDVIVSGSHTFSSNASTSGLTIASGGSLTAPSQLTVAGSYTNNGTFTHNSGTWYATAVSQPETYSGTLIGSSAFNNLIFDNTATITLGANASTSDLTITTNGQFDAGTATLSLTGDYTNNGTFTASTSELVFNGTTQQTATGTMTGASNFYNLSIANTSGSGASSQSVIFGSDVAASGTMTMLPGTSAQFTANTTATFENIDWGGESGSEIYLRSSSDGTPWQLTVSGSQLAVDYVDVQDSDASGTSGGIAPTNSTDSGNNTNWNFPIPEWSASSWNLYDTITIDATKVDDDLTDFPVYVDLADLSSQFWSTTPASASLVGTDIRVTTDSGSPTELPRELVFASSTAQTGELHFKADSISSTTDTVFRIYYNGTTTGDYGKAATYGAQNVWTNNYVAVWHMQEDPTGSGAVLDSTVNQLHGTGESSMTSADLVDGKLDGKALDFDGGSTDYITVGSQSVLDNLGRPNGSTICTWYEHDTYPNTYPTLVNKSDVGLDNGFNLYLGSAGRVGYYTPDGDYNEPDFTLTGGWKYLCGTWTGVNGSSGIDVYGNGTNLGDRAGTASSLDDAAYNFTIGARDGGGVPIDGRMDELRLASTTRTTAWISAEYTNQSTTTDFYTVGSAEVTAGGLILANHPAGQADNLFSYANKTAQPFFAFALASTTEQVAISSLQMSLTGVDDVTTSNLDNLGLYIDTDNDGAYDSGTDTHVSTGTLSIAGRSGTVTFSDSFTVSATTSYLVIADTVSIDRGASLVVELFRTDITATGVTTSATITPSGSVTAVQHQRLSGGGGSYRGGGTGNNGVGNGIGSAPPAGDATTTGGTNQGGQQIGADPDYYRPTTDAGNWTNPQYAYDNTDGTYAQDTSNATTSFANHGFSVPGTDSIDGIAVQLEVSAVTGAGTIDVQLSWDGGASWTTAKTTPTLTNTDTVVTLGGASDTWGRSWSANDFSNANFAVLITGSGSGNTLQIDAIQVKVFHAATGGGPGGGGGGGLGGGI